MLITAWTQNCKVTFMCTCVRTDNWNIAYISWAFNGNCLVICCSANCSQRSCVSASIIICKVAFWVEITVWRHRDSGHSSVILAITINAQVVTTSVLFIIHAHVYATVRTYNCHCFVHLRLWCHMPVNIVATILNETICRVQLSVAVSYCTCTVLYVITV